MKPLEAKLILGDIVNEIDLIIKRESTPEGWQWLIWSSLWGALP